MNMKNWIIVLFIFFKKYTVDMQNAFVSYIERKDIHMDKTLLLQIGLITIPFIALSIFVVVNIISSNMYLNKNEKNEKKKLKVKRKITKRPDSNIYDINLRRRE